MNASERPAESGEGPSPVPDLAPFDAARQIAKLRKINAALIQRVERSMEQQGNAYALFQTAIGLEAQVRLRTEELNAALRQLEETNLALVAARDAAERANLVKTRFFTSVGHDLLQPLHAARLTTSALDGTVKPVEQARLGAQIEHALSTIEELLRTILDLSKLEAGVVRPSIETVSLPDLFASLLTDLGPVALEKRLALTCRATPYAVLTDPMMMRRILQNLVSNAIRYTEHGEVKIAARRRGSDIRIEVWDTGPGIAPSELSRIFDEFERGEAAGRIGGGGFGLGLSIVRRMALALNHPITVCSRVGRGTRFAITAPAGGLAAERAVPMAPDPCAAREAYGFARAQVLVLDNDDTVLEAMKGLLSRWSCDVRAARSLEDVERILDCGDFSPAILLADYHLEHGACGLDVVRRARAMTGREIPAVVVTADHSAAIEAESRALGCEILRKPVRPAELRALMGHLLS